MLLTQTSAESSNVRMKNKLRLYGIYNIKKSSNYNYILKQSTIKKYSINKSIIQAQKRRKVENKLISINIMLITYFTYA